MWKPIELMPRAPSKATLDGLKHAIPVDGRQPSQHQLQQPEQEIDEAEEDDASGLHVLEPGDFISTLAGTAASITTQLYMFGYGYHITHEQ